MSKYLWRFYWDFGRSGSLYGLFVATETEVEEMIGKEVYFGEVLGKHSEVYGTLESGDFSKLDISPEAVEEVSKVLGKTWSGFNPKEYIFCSYCEETLYEDSTIKYREEFDTSLCDECYKEELNESEENYL